MITKINSELINRIGNEIEFFFDFVQNDRNYK